MIHNNLVGTTTPTPMGRPRPIVNCRLGLLPPVSEAGKKHSPSYYSVVSGGGGGNHTPGTNNSKARSVLPAAAHDMSDGGRLLMFQQQQGDYLRDMRAMRELAA